MSPLVGLEYEEKEGDLTITMSEQMQQNDYDEFTQDYEITSIGKEDNAHNLKPLPIQYVLEEKKQVKSKLSKSKSKSPLSLPEEETTVNRRP